MRRAARASYSKRVGSFALASVEPVQYFTGNEARGTSVCCLGDGDPETTDQRS